MLPKSTRPRSAFALAGGGAGPARFRFRPRNHVPSTNTAVCRRVSALVPTAGQEYSPNVRVSTGYPAQNGRPANDTARRHPVAPHFRENGSSFRQEFAGAPGGDNGVPQQKEYQQPTPTQNTNNPSAPPPYNIRQAPLPTQQANQMYSPGNDQTEILLVGNCGADPIYREGVSRNGSPWKLATFNLAVKKQLAPSWVSTGAETEWFTISAWDFKADIAIQTVRKGTKVVVKGSYAVDYWTDNTTGQQRAKAKVIAAYIEAVVPTRSDPAVQNTATSRVSHRPASTMGLHQRAQSYSASDQQNDPQPHQRVKVRRQPPQEYQSELVRFEDRPAPPPTPDRSGPIGDSQSQLATAAQSSPPPEADYYSAGAQSLPTGHLNRSEEKQVLPPQDVFKAAELVRQTGGTQTQDTSTFSTNTSNSDMGGVYDSEEEYIPKVRGSKNSLKRTTGSDFDEELEEVEYDVRENEYELEDFDYHEVETGKLLPKVGTVGRSSPLIASRQKATSKRPASATRSPSQMKASLPSTGGALPRRQSSKQVPEELAPF